MQVSAASFGQRITLTERNATLEQVLKKIKIQSGFDMLFINNQMDQAKKVNINVNNVPLIDALELIFKSQPLQYTIVDKMVVIKLRKQIPIDASASSSLQLNVKEERITISGKVVDEEGTVVERASITVKGSNVGTVADNLGNFTITLPAKSSGILIISSVGYASQEYIAKKSTTITIVLSRQAMQGDEVVVVGMGTQKKKFLTNSVSIITAKDIENLPMTNIYEVLNGRVPGLRIQRDYTPGGNRNDIDIRGKATGYQYKPGFTNGQEIPISTNNFGFGNSQPLILIDGFEGDMNAINPQDIESVSVLKDASAAIYGIRAANGVILITTKQGLENSLRVNYDYNIGLQSFSRQPSYLPSWQQATLVNEAIANEGAAGAGGGIGGGLGFTIGGGGNLVAYTSEQIQKFKDGTDPAYPNTNWEKLFYKQHPVQQRHNLGLSGGDKRSKYALSFEYFDQAGSLPGAKANRYNARFNINTRINEKLLFNGGLSFSSKPVVAPVVGTIGFFSGGANSDLLNYVNKFSPTIPLQWANGAYSNNGSSISPQAWEGTDSKYKSSNSIMNGNLGLNWKPITGLSINPSASFNYNVNDVKTFVDKVIGYNNTPVGVPLTPNYNVSSTQSSLYTSTNKSYAITGQLIANYNKIFGNHEIDIMAGGLRSYAYAENFSAQRYNLLNSAIQTISIAPILNQSVSGGQLESVQQSVFGRLRYNYNDIVVLESTLRSDGNTAFAPENRYQIFPAFSGAWLISSHHFYKNSPSLVKAMSFLKLRASYGILGNSAVGYYAYLRRLSTNTYSFNGQPGLIVYPESGFNQALEWERTKTADIGLDARLLKDKLSLTLDWYNKQTDGMIQSGSVTPPNYGLQSAYENAGSVRNRGFEASVNYNDKIGNVTWNVGANMSYQKAKLLKYLQQGLNTTSLFVYSVYKEGADPYAIYGLQSNGIYQTQAEVTGSPVLNSTVGPGDIRYIDQNKDGKIDGADRVTIGTYRAPWSYGFTLGSAWKNFNLQLFFRGAIGQSSLMGSALGVIANSSNKVVTDFWNRWTPENHNTEFPRAWSKYTQNDPVNTVSDFWLRSADYLKLDNLTFSYNLPQKICKKVAMNNVRVFYSGQNILTFAPGYWKWLDPETVGPQASSLYPSIINHSFGISVGL
jgi:TonB-linked SusC/RagA family outer membrane protein